MKKMTSKERFRIVISGGIPDRVPWVDYIEDDLAVKILGKPIKSRSKKWFNAPEIVQYLGMDSFLFRIVAPEFCETRLIDGRELRGSGQIKSLEDLQKIEFPDIDKMGFYEEAEELIKYYGDDFAIILSTRCGFMNTVLALGYEGFSYALYDSPELVSEIYKRMNDWTIRALEKVKTLPFDAIFMTDDIAYKRGLLFSPDILEKYLFPNIPIFKEILGTSFMFHSDGNYSSIIPRLLDLKVDVIANIEPEAMDIFELKKEYGKSITIMGNIDLDYTLTLGTPEETYQEVKEKLQKLSVGGRYFLSSSNSLPNYCKPENILAIKEALDKYGRYDI